MADYTNPAVVRNLLNKTTVETTPVDQLEDAIDAVAARLSAMKLPGEWSTTCFHPSENRRQFANFAKAKAGGVTIEDVTIERRIGSQSMNAMVYEGSVEGQRVAVKFMPRVYRDSWDWEVRVAQLLGNMALRDPGKPFPIVVGSGETTVELPENFPKAVLASKETARINAVAQGKNKLEALLVAQESKFTKKVYARYLISELATSDLQSVSDPSSYRKQMKCALRELHSAGYAHGDAHLGNFLLTPDNAVLIHDFGDTIETTSAFEFAEDLAKLDEALSRHTAPR
jgi:serine/threonine protein kinase